MDTLRLGYRFKVSGVWRAVRVQAGMVRKTHSRKGIQAVRNVRVATDNVANRPIQIWGVER